MVCIFGGITIKSKKQKSIALIISAILGILYSIYLVSHFGGAIFGANSDAEAIGGAIASALVAPHMACVAVATIFNGIAALTNKRGFALVGAILYVVGAALFLMYAFFVLPSIILSFIGYAKLGKLAKAEPKPRPVAQGGGPDFQLMQRIQRGDREAFATLYATYNQMVFATAMAQTGNQQQAMEIVKIVFREAYQSILANGPYPGDVYEWLHTLTMRQLGQPMRLQHQPQKQIYGQFAGSTASKVYQEPHKAWYKRVWVWLPIAVVGLVIFISALNPNPDTIASPTYVPAASGSLGSGGGPPAETREETPAEEIQREYKVGDTIRVGNLEVTVYRVWTSEGSDFRTPDAGNVFYFMDVIIANKGESAESISTMLMFDLRDSEGYSIGQSFSAYALGQSGLDGTVLPEKVIRGDIGFEVPANPFGYELQINLSVFGSAGLFSVHLDNIADDATTKEIPQSTKTGSEIQLGMPHTTGTLEIVVNSIRFSNGEDFFKPDEGNEYLLVDVSIQNNGNEAETISSMLMFDLHDANGYSYSISLGAESLGKGGLSGDVMAGRTLRGELGFEVPIGAIGLELMVNPDVFGSDELFIVTLN